MPVMFGTIVHKRALKRAHGYSFWKKLSFFESELIEETHAYL